MKTILLILALMAGTSSAFANNPRGYSVQVISDQVAFILNKQNVRLRQFRCNSGMQADGTYLVNCPRNLNPMAEFKSVLKFEAEDNHWIADPNTSVLKYLGEEPVLLTCRATGEDTDHKPAFNFFLCGSF